MSNTSNKDPNRKKTISFSQFSNWYSCPNKWQLDYIKGLKKFEDNLIMSFGTAIHETIQTYLNALYNISEKKADKMDMLKYFTWAFDRQIKLKKIPHTEEEKNGFIEDGRNILIAFRKLDNRLKHFPTDKYTLVDIEHQVKMDVQNNVYITAYLDLVLKERMTGKIKIIDMKTSTNAWTNYQKEDFTKISQLLLYKALYSKKHNIPMHMIDVEFFILRRKLYENASFPQSHIQVFRPNSSHENVSEVIEEMSKFVEKCFTKDGKYKLDAEYPKIPGKNKKNCKYCQYKNKECDAIPS